MSDNISLVPNCNTTDLLPCINSPDSTDGNENVTLPREEVNKMIKDALPNIDVTNDVNEIIMNSCKQFIRLISTEAKHICGDADVMSEEHILIALDQLGFGEYRAQLEEAAVQCLSKRREQKLKVQRLLEQQPNYRSNEMNRALEAAALQVATQLTAVQQVDVQQADVQQAAVQN